MTDERLLILQMLRDGKITVDEAEKLLAAVESGKNESKSGAAGPEQQDKEKGQEKSGRDPWNELGDVWEKFGGEMEKFWNEFGETMNENLGQKWARKMEHWAQNFGESLKTMSRDWTVIAGEAARQFFDSMGVDADVVIDFDRRGVEMKEAFHWEQEAGSIHEVLLQNQRGSMVIEGWDEDRIEIDGEKLVSADTEEKARELLASLSFSPVVNETSLTISTTSNLPQPNRVVWHLRAKIPAGCRLDIRQIKGPVSLSGFRNDVSVSGQAGSVKLKSIEGSIRLQLSKGDMALADCRGEGSIQLAKGDISLHNISGAYSLNLMKGDLAVAGCAGLFKIRSAMGDTAIRGHRGNLDIVIAKGDIAVAAVEATSMEITCNYGDQSIRFTPQPGGNYSFIAHHGDVALGLEGTLNASFDLQVIRGDLQSNFLKLPSSGSPLRVSQKIGNGEASIKVNVVKGDLELLNTEKESPQSEVAAEAAEAQPPVETNRPPSPPEPRGPA